MQKRLIIIKRINSDEKNIKFVRKFLVAKKNIKKVISLATKILLPKELVK